MTNLLLLKTRDEIHEHFLKLWKTDEIRTAHANGLSSRGKTHGFIYDIVEKFAALPRIIGDMSDPEIETAHFSPWWGVFGRREYDSPVIHDLFWVHDMVHAGEMVYVPNLSFQNWKMKMVENELLASVISEIVVYLEFPTLRAKSFPYAIFGDRFFEDEGFLQRWKANRALAIEELKIHRRNAMINQAPKDESEAWIHRFANQNDAWAACWSFRYNEVEEHMAALRNVIIRGKLTWGALFLKEWLEEAGAKDNGVPFATEAKAFAGIYWAGKEAYARMMAPKSGKSKSGKKMRKTVTLSP